MGNITNFGDLKDQDQIIQNAWSGRLKIRSPKQCTLENQDQSDCDLENQITWSFCFQSSKERGSVDGRVGI